jgi:diguanylate cyclase (GGDEF)-like protein
MTDAIRTINAVIEKLPRWAAVLLGLSFMAAMGFLDIITGPDYSFSIFYLVGVVCTAWYAGRKPAIFMAAIGTVLWLVASLAGKQYSGYPLSLFWNDFAELGLFLFAAVVISTLKELLVRAEENSRTDHLTGIANRRRFYEQAEEEIRRVRRFRDPFTLLYIDIDNFKTVNDTLGHNEGDRLLLSVASTIRIIIRECDTVARLGGDEFGLILPKTGTKEAVTVAGKMRAALKAIVEEKWPVTFSIGMVTYREAPASTDEMILTAEQLMYEVKNTGKNELRHLVVPELE